MNSLPKQKLPISKKGVQWKEDCVNYYERLSYTEQYSYRSSNYRKAINYDLYNGRFDIKDFEYVCNPLGIKGAEFPAQMQHYDIISPAINLLMGEEIKRPDNFKVISESADVISEKERMRKQVMMQSLQSMLQAQLDPESVDPNNPPPTPEQVEEYMKYSYQDVREIIANRTLNYLKRFLNTRHTYNRGWKDALIAGEEIYWSGIVNGDPVLRRCNPLDITVVLDNDSDFIDDAQAVVEIRRMTIGNIIDEFGDFLTEGQISELEEYLTGQAGNTDFRFNGASTVLPDRLVLNTITNQDPTDKVSPTNLYRANQIAFNGNIRVVHIEWKSMRKVGTYRFFDEDGVQQEILIDENFKPKDLDASSESIEWFWIPEAWEGTKIGKDIFVNIRPKPNQRKRLDNPYYCKLGYTGLIYNATNSVSVSLVDRMKPYQYLYNILMYRLELAFASDMGKVFLMDIAQIPTSEGWNVEQWMYYLKAMKIAFINSHEVGKSGPTAGQRSNFNQFQSLDLTMGNYIQQHINSLEYIKNQVAFLSGVSPQRLGAISSNELVGNVERSVNQSAHITEPWFEAHNQVKRNAYTSLLECAKIAWRDGKKIQYVLDDMATEFFEIDGPEFENTEFSVFVSNSGKDDQVLESLKQLSQVALQSDKANLSEVVRMLKSDSITEVTRMLENGEAKRMQQAQEQNQMQQQMQQEALQAQMQQKEAEMDLKRYEIDSNNQTKIQVAEINVFSRQEELDTNGDGIPDPIALADQALKEREQFSKDYERKTKAELERKKVESDLKLRDKELQMKEKELASKEKIEKLKAETALKVARQNKNKYDSKK